MKKLLFIDKRNIGCDPEFFFVKDNKVVPSGEVDGINTYDDTVVEDGFQGELNPDADTCRESLASDIGRSLMSARKIAKDMGADISFKVGHIISDDVWKRTPSEQKKYGCNPTTNVHENKFSRVTGIREKFRAAGGHLHFTLRDGTDVKKLVAVMDIVVANTCVLIDRDPDNARRRKNYGRAGEYRIKRYGMEYRVPSNFWLKHYALFSMVSQLGRNSIDILRSDLADELISRFSMLKVRKAINDNDFDLAKENFQILMQFIKDHKAEGNGLACGRIDTVYKWLTSEDPMKVFGGDSIDNSMASWEEIYYEDPEDVRGFESTMYKLHCIETGEWYD